MNHNSPIRNDKLLREAYEAGRRQSLNEMPYTDWAYWAGYDPYTDTSYLLHPWWYENPSVRAPAPPLHWWEIHKPPFWWPQDHPDLRDYFRMKQVGDIV